MKTQNVELQEIIQKIIANYTNLDENQVEKLIQATNEIGGCSMISLGGYSSDKSNNTEVAKHLINIGASYEKMKIKDSNIFDTLNSENVVNIIDINKFDYNSIDLNGISLTEYKKQVTENLPIALAELQSGKKPKDTSNDIWLNKALVFNLNTMRLSIFGQRINKTIEVKGEYKKTASKPKTISKKLIEEQTKSKTNILGRFALDNLIGQININKDTVEIG